MKNQKNILKSIIFFFIFLFLFSVIVNEIISIDLFHLHTCKINNCQRCIAIHNAINFFKNLCHITVLVTILNIIIALIFKIVVESYLSKKETLVSLNIILNE